MESFFNIEIEPEKLPRHVGIIMDGNGRWARKRNLPRMMGHERGFAAIKRIIEFNKNLEVPYITIFAFSTENWRRPKDEVNFIMGLAKKLFMEYTDTLLKNDVRLRITGIREHIDSDFLKLMEESLHRTEQCRKFTLNIAFNYGGRREIADAAKNIAVDVKEGRLDPEHIDEALVQQYLYSPDIPDVDLMIRTSGELRLSNFLLWQCAYSEFYFSDKLWPDFSPEDFIVAIKDYQNRKRRFGDITNE